MNFKSIFLLVAILSISSCAMISDFTMSSEDQNELRMSEEALSTLYKRHGIERRNVIEVPVPQAKRKTSRVSEDVLIDSNGKEVR